MATIRVGLCLHPDAPAAPADARRLEGADILVFPEMVDSGYAALRAGAAPHRRGDDLLRRFAAMSTVHAPYCIAGSVYLQEPPPARSNTSLVFHSGRRVHRYDKIHLFRPAGDHRYFRSGLTLKTFTASLPSGRVRCGVIICYDLRFPELVRVLALRGLDVLFVPARWPAVRDDAWRTLLKARAIENQIFVVGCNAQGAEGGPSYVFDPLGVEVFTNRTALRSRVHCVDLELARLEDARKLHRNLDEAVVLRSSTMARRVTARRRPQG
jgi:predicted amidohydrolase